jgi:CAAX prenyl protease-like protein
MDRSANNATAAPSPRSFWHRVPEAPRALPFLLFVGVTLLEGKLFPGSEYWFYAVKTVLVGWMLWSLRGYLPELKWAFGWEGFGIGALLGILWIGLDGSVIPLNEILARIQAWLTGETVESPSVEPAWNPLTHFPDHPALAWMFVAIRVVGRTLVVPPLEEVFYRSFFYRSIAARTFTDISLGAFRPVAFLVTCIVFSVSHPSHWLAALICGAAFQFLVLRRKRLGDAILAHAITNLLTSAHAVATDGWRFS